MPRSLREKRSASKGQHIKLRCYSVGGFSLHANTSTNPLQREKLGGLIEYVARGPLANDRLEIVADKIVKLCLKTPYTDGTTHILLSFSEFIEKLVALIPLGAMGRSSSAKLAPKKTDYA